MSNADITLLLIVLLTSALYSLLILSFTKGWIRLKQGSLKEKYSTSISVIIPLRNEEDSLEKLFELLMAQHYPTDLHEFIFVNDHSTDHGLELLEEHEEKNKFKVISLPDDVTGKKAAIGLGIENASGHLITTLDADCMPGPNWLAGIATSYEETKCKMIAGPVAIYEPKGVLASFQALELLSLVSSGGGAIGIGKPIMCNGANLSYEKEVFETVGGFRGNEHIPGGDDMFLMEKINKQFPPGNIGFNKNPESIVYTRASSNLKEFLNQRFRWVAKSPAYSNPFLISSALIVLLFNLCLLAALVFAFISLLGLLIFAGLFILKCIVDFPILRKATKFAGQDQLMANYIPFQFVYFFFISLSGILGNVISFSWKGRRRN